MENYTLVSIFDKLIGDIRAYGSHGSDMYNYDKLDSVSELLNYILTKLIQNAKNKDSAAQSVNLVGEKSYNILCSLQEDMSEVIK